MRCMMCEAFSLSHLCKACLNRLEPRLYTSYLDDATRVLSFYNYSDIETLLLSKHTDVGYYIYSLLGENTFKVFGDAFEFEERVASISVDDRPIHGYSHTALLNRALKSKSIKPHYGILRSRNNVRYAGASLVFRKAHPRNFTCKPFDAEYVIVVDDIITTGTTLEEAVARLKKEGKNVLFCLTLAYVKR